MAEQVNSLRVAIDSNKAKVGAAQYVAATKSMKKGSDLAAKSVSKLERRSFKLAKTAISLRGSLGGLFVGIGFAATMRRAITTMAKFEETMSTVKGVTGASAEEFKALSETARELGASTRFTASQAGEGLLFLARAGFETNEAIAALPATLDLATAGAIDLGEAADFASNILTQFGLSAAETVRIADTLVVVSNASNTNVRQLAEAMKFAGPIAGKLGISIEETASAIGVLGDAGIQGSMAGTNLRQVMLALIAPTSKAKKVLKEMGITMDQVNPSANSLAEIFTVLKEANLSAEQSLALFNTRSLAGALQITGFVDKLKDLTLASEGGAGAAAAMARVMDDNLSGSFLRLNSAIEEAFLKTGDKGMLGAMRQIVDSMTEVVSSVTGGSELMSFAINNASTNMTLAALGVQFAWGEALQHMTFAWQEWSILVNNGFDTLQTGFDSWVSDLKSVGSFFFGSDDFVPPNRSPRPQQVGEAARKTAQETALAGIRSRGEFLKGAVVKDFLIRELEILQDFNKVAKETEEIDPFKEYRDGLENLKEVEKEVAKLEKTTSSVENAMTSSFTSIAFNAGTAEEAIVSLGRSIAQIILQQSIAQPIAAGLLSFASTNFGAASHMEGGANFIGPIQGSAMGNVFNNGSITPFANGGIVNRSTLFPMKNGAGLMGEAGPEAVLPLTRGADGKLGVSSVGGGGAGDIEINIINESGQPLSSDNATAHMDFDKLVVTAVVKNFDQGGQMRTMISRGRSGG